MTIDTSYEEKKNIKSSSLSQVDVILDGVDNDDWEDIAVNVEVRNSNPFKLHRQLQLGKGSKKWKSKMAFTMKGGVSRAIKIF